MNFFYYEPALKGFCWQRFDDCTNMSVAANYAFWENIGYCKLSLITVNIHMYCMYHCFRELVRGHVIHFANSDVIRLIILCLKVEVQGKFSFCRQKKCFDLSHKMHIGLSSDGQENNEILSGKYRIMSDFSDISPITC